jgi:CubicO group peptidase (beta-lactamase class C family)
MPLLTFLLIILTSTSFAQASPWSDALKARLDSVVQRNFENKSQVGLVVGVVSGNETHIWGYGERKLGERETPDGNTYFEMGSITKTYTATLLAEEVLLGRVRLESPVKSLWPELKGTDAGEITLEQLATHSSGLPRMPDNFAPVDPLNPYKDYDEGKLLDFLQRFRQTKKPPYEYSYSNVGMGLLGFLLAKKLHRQSFADYLAENLLQPLGLNDTKTALTESDLARAAQGYGNFFQLFPFWELNVLSPAGVLKTTASDLLKYVQFNMGEGDGLLNRAASLAHQARAPTDQEGFRIGLAWESGKLGDHQILTHSGATGGYRANLAFDEKEKLGVVVLSNTDMNPHCVVSVAFGAACEVERWVSVSPRWQQKLVGTYHSKAMGIDADVFQQSGFLGLRVSGEPLMRLWAKSDLAYEIPDAAAKLTFQFDKAGRVDRFTLKQGGDEVEFLRR